jgi:hypothetical protein
MLQDGDILLTPNSRSESDTNITHDSQCRIYFQALQALKGQPLMCFLDCSNLTTQLPFGKLPGRHTALQMFLGFYMLIKGFSAISAGKTL